MYLESTSMEVRRVWSMRGAVDCDGRVQSVSRSAGATLNASGLNDTRKYALWRVSGLWAPVLVLTDRIRQANKVRWQPRSSWSDVEYFGS